MARLVAVCASKKRQEPKSPLAQGRLLSQGGIEGDSHGDHEKRPISLLRMEDIRAAQEAAGFEIPPGALAENLVVEGLPEDLPPGTRLSIGTEVLLEVVEKGKRPDEPHSYDYRGLCLLPTAGFFLRVLEGGVIEPEDLVVLC